jgi:ABC-type enterochelin transport system substrate-binding protein
MPSLKSDHSKIYSTQEVFGKDHHLKSNNTNINNLLNRVKINNKQEIKKKFIILSLAISLISITGIIVF